MCKQGNVGTLSTGLTTSGIGRFPEIDEEPKGGGGRGDIYVSVVIVNFTSSDNLFIGILMSNQILKCIGSFVVGSICY